MQDNEPQWDFTTENAGEDQVLLTYRDASARTQPGAGNGDRCSLHVKVWGEFSNSWAHALLFHFQLLHPTLPKLWIANEEMACIAGVYN